MAEAQSAPRRAGGLLAVSVVFMLGMVCGAASFFVGVRLLQRAPELGWRVGARDGRLAMARMSRELGLDAKQRDQVRAVIARRRTEVREILESGRDEIRDLLRPDQRERFDRMGPARRAFSRRGPPPPDR
jgi:Spy/CpxP family protein refolding chaperone